MGQCLVSSTSAQEKTALVRWVFANAALHPQVSSIADVTEQDKAAMDRKMAALVEKLVTDDCREETKQAVQYEGGQTAFRTSFQILGKVAMRELMNNPEVRDGFQSFSQYMDKKKLEELGIQQ